MLLLCLYSFLRVWRALLQQQHVTATLQGCQLAGQYMLLDTCHCCPLQSHAKCAASVHAKANNRSYNSALQGSLHMVKACHAQKDLTLLRVTYTSLQDTYPVTVLPPSWKVSRQQLYKTATTLMQSAIRQSSANSRAPKQFADSAVLN
jgi:mRNA-degrading endonuclease YafQ of YafQ-DinJ toxin-antitoxin module